MRAEQRGDAYRTKTKGWGIRWREADGSQPRLTGFPTKTAALAYYRDEIRPRLERGASSVDGSYTLAAFAELYLEAYAGTREPRSVESLRERLARPLAAFGDVTLRDLERRAPEIAAWRASLPAGARYRTMRALRQTLTAAEQWGAILRNPAVLAGPNPAP